MSFDTIVFRSIRLYTHVSQMVSQSMYLYSNSSVHACATYIWNVLIWYLMGVNQCILLYLMGMGQCIGTDGHESVCIFT